MGTVIMRLVLLTVLGAVLGVGVGATEALAITALVSRPSDAAPMILASSWVVAVVPLTYARRPSSSDMRSARRWFAVSFLVAPVATAVVYALEHAS
jgi:hypothetical protein